MTYLTASEEVLVAAYKLTEKGKKEFTEWELTVETWLLNKSRWGLKGYEDKYPDHKRVMNEIMAKGANKVMGRGWVKRIKPNYYSITNSGLSRVNSLLKLNTTTKNRNLFIYNTVQPYVIHKSFVDYCSDSTEPKTWLGAASFLGITKNDPDILERNMRRIKEDINLAIEWLEENKENLLRRDDSAKPISKDQLVKLKEFIAVLEKRFKQQIDAIKSKN